MLQPIVFVVAIAFVTVTADRIDQIMCPKGWSYFENSCYYIGPVGVDFQNAEYYCESLDSKLATISSKEEHDHIKSLVQDDDARGVWFGLFFTNGKWENRDWRLPVTFLNWAQNEPVTSFGARCASLYKYRGWAWKSDHCTASTGMAYICEKRSSKGSFLQACTSRTCFKLFEDRALRDYAKLYCKRLRGSLASIRSEEESNAVKNVLTSVSFLQHDDWAYGRPDLWLAGSDSGSEGVWYWDIEGQRQNISDGFTNWMANEPNNAGPSGTDENCMVMAPGNWKWNDIACDSYKFPLCEISEQDLIALNGY